MSLAYLHVRDSHFGKVDVPMTFLIMCSVLFIVKSYQERTLWGYVGAGLFAGLAMSTKYAGILLVLPMFAAHYVNVQAEGAGWKRLALDRRITAFSAALVLAFLAGTPFAILAFREFVSWFTHEMGLLDTAYGTAQGRGWWCHLKFSLFFGLGWSLLLASLLGTVLILRKDLRTGLVLFLFPVIYYILSGKGYTVFVRYTIPTIPFLCISAAALMVSIGDRLAAHFRSDRREGIACLMATLILTPSILNVIRCDALLTKRDSRLLATEWVYQNVAAGSSIWQSDSHSDYGKLELLPTLASQAEAYGALLKKPAGATAFDAKRLKARMDYMRERNIPGYDQWLYDAESGRFTHDGGEPSTSPAYLITVTSPLVCYIPEGIEQLMKTSYDLVKSFEVIEIGGRKSNLFDRQDMFFVPFAGFKNVKRPGPNLHIYKKH